MNYVNGCGFKRGTWLDSEVLAGITGGGKKKRRDKTGKPGFLGSGSFQSFPNRPLAFLPFFSQF